MAKRIQVGGRIESKEVGGIVTGAAEILDDAKGKKQSVINGETDDELVRLDQSKQDNLTFDNAPTEGSDNPVKSGGVYAADKALSDAIEAILLLIPSAASALNKLVDTSMMNSSISTATATFKGTYNVVTDLSLTIDATHEQIAAALGNAISTADNNDYAFVQIPVSAESTDIRCTERYKFNGTAWGYEYDLNTSGFTAAQWGAINSGITLALVGKLIGLPTSSELQALLGQKQNTLTFDNVPTAGSANPVKSGGVYTAINDEKTAREQLAQTVTGIDGRVGNIEEVIPTGAAANNKLVANNSMEAYVSSIIGAITASFTIATGDGHINLTLTQTSGRVASLTLTSSDIASAQALTALTGRVSTAEGNITSLGGRMTTAEGNITSLGGRVSTNETDIANLQQLYNDLQQSKPVPVTALPSTGQQQGVIYRLAGTTSYSDYMWNGTTWVLMATYNNAIDDEPFAGSDNLVKSGGVNESLSVELSNVVIAALQHDENFVLNSNNWVLRKGWVNSSGVIDTSFYHIHLINKNIGYINLSGGTTGVVGVNYITGKKNGSYEDIKCNFTENGNKRGNYYVEDYDELYINIFPITEAIDTITLYPKHHFENDVDKQKAEEIYLTSESSDNAVSGFYYGLGMPLANGNAKYCKVCTRGKYKTLIVGASTENHSIYDVIKRNKSGACTGITNGIGMFDISDAEELYLNFFGNDRQYLLVPEDVQEVEKGLNEQYLIYNSTTSKFILSGYYNAGFTWSGGFNFIIINCKNAKTISALYGNDTGVYALFGLKTNDLSITNLGNKGTYDIDEYDYILFNVFDDTYISDVFVNYSTHIFDDVVLKPFSFNGKTALFTGDSITAGYVNGTDIDTTNAWPTLFSDYVGLTPTNRAVGGATIATVEGKAKILNQISGANQFDFLFIAGGLNDCNLNVDLDTFKNAVDDLIDAVLNYSSANPNMRTIFVTPINHCLGYGSKEEFLNLQKYRNIITEEVLKKNNGTISVVQGNKFPFPKVGDSFGYINAMFGDLVHPSALGYKSCYTAGMIDALF